MSVFNQAETRISITMPKQDQRVGEGATAIQTTGDVSIGISPVQMGEIMMSLASQLHIYFSDAETKAEERFQKFRDDVLEQFANTERANPEAFKEPDFQYLLRDAQAAFARSGDEDVGNALVGLLAQRSLLTSGSRAALILNQATETVSKLTKEELAVLTVGFVLIYTGGGAGNYSQLLARIESLVVPLIDSLPSGRTSHDYLASLGCISIVEMVIRDLSQVWLTTYSGIFSTGFEEAELSAVLPDAARFALLSPVLMRCLNSPGKLQFNAASDGELPSILKSRGLSDDEIGALTTLAQSKKMSGSDVADRLRGDIPGYDKLEAVWQDTPLNKINLTALGIALAHANAVRLWPDFGAPLSIWLS